MSKKVNGIDTIEGEMGKWLGIRYVATVDLPTWRKSPSPSDTFLFVCGEMKNSLENIVGTEEFLSDET